jgi:LAS superfamily LD-carboxypeptidase LdcB
MWRRIAASVLVTAVVFAIGFPSVAGAASPIQPNNRPTPVPGQTNGELPARMLVRINADCITLREVAPSLQLLLRSAQGQGVGLFTDECYRPLAGQVAAADNWTARGNSACAASVSRTPDGRPVGNSYHGWGKATDFTWSDGLRFDSPVYRWLKAEAARFGWNHPAFAEPGGSACPEPWHWEWVGDGGRYEADRIRADVVGMLPTASGQGYSVVTGLGALTHRGDATDQGSAAGIPINWLVVGGARMPGGSGYWLVAADGGIFGFGGATFLGSTGGMRLNQPIVGMAATPTGKGYWLVASDGGIFSFGDAAFQGSMGGRRLNRPIVGMAATPTGKGYWLVASDGGMFAFGDARFMGSTGSIKLNRPITTMTPTPDGNGYWLSASDGGIFAYGNAQFQGSTGQNPSSSPVVGMASTRTGKGYWLVAANGTVSNFGDAGAFGAG